VTGRKNFAEKGLTERTALMTLGASGGRVLTITDRLFIVAVMRGGSLVFPVNDCILHRGFDSYNIIPVILQYTQKSVQ
jgi:hypothetical protein